MADLSNVPDHTDVTGGRYRKLARYGSAGIIGGGIVGIGWAVARYTRQKAEDARSDGIPFV